MPKSVRPILEPTSPVGAVKMRRAHLLVATARVGLVKVQPHDVAVEVVVVNYVGSGDHVVLGLREVDPVLPAARQSAGGCAGGGWGGVRTGEVARQVTLDSSALGEPQLYQNL